MKLSTLLKDVEVLDKLAYSNCNIVGLTHIDKECDKGYLYFALKGNSFDGVMYCINAVKNGAKCIVTQNIIDGIECTQIIVKDVRIAMSTIARNYYCQSDLALKIIGVVGTSGKTTTSSILYNIIKDSGKKVGFIGTLGIKIGNMHLPNNMTTPDPIELHYVLNQMVSFGIEYVVIEISAQAIYYNKLYGIKTIATIFTNISAEHLDFFENIQNYANVKINYFDKQNTSFSIVNIDDKFGRLIAKNSNTQVITYGLSYPADTFAIDIKTTLNKCSFVINVFDQVFKVSSKLIGEYNVYNIMAAITVAKLIGISNQDIVYSLGHIPAIEGRLEVFNFTRGNKVVIDFAHTPTEFDKVLSLLRALRPKGKLITLFGCVGYSDKQKRKDMGLIAQKYSDYIILTSDNPDFVSFDIICADVNITQVPYKCIVDRKEALQYGVNLLTQNDTLVCLGKGGENKQRINGVNLPYSEKEIVNNLLKRQVK